MWQSINKLKGFVFKFFLEGKIIRKWIVDGKFLPLTREHFELYRIIHKRFFQKFGFFPDLIAGESYNEKMQWLRLFDQDEIIIKCSDKVQVRDHIKERVGEKYLVQLYQVHNRFEEIDFPSLPDSFVIKANHDSGTVIPVWEKEKFDKKAAKERINRALSKPFGWEEGEWAYSFIKPKVLVEEFIDPERGVLPEDYKFYCVEGRVKLMHYIYDRGTDPKEQVIDRGGQTLNTYIYPSFKLGDKFKKPEEWEEMIKVAEEISKGFKFVRVDLYLSKERIYAGEMTFWPMGGMYKGEGQKEIGKYLDFDRTTFKKPVYKRLKRFKRNSKLT